MDQEKLKLIIKNLELLVSSLKSEVYSNTESYLNYDEIIKSMKSYDDDDGYADWLALQWW